MNSFDKQFMTIVKNVMEKGYYDNNRTGVPTKKLPHQIMQFDLEKEFPVSQSKKLAFKTAVKEILWIYQMQSNDVRELQKQNVKIWNEWMLEDGTIGKAYGYQVAKFKQIDKLIETLKTNPQDRRMIMNLWNIEDLPEMALQPCCFLTIWDVTDGRLNCMLVQRSADLGLGVPFNTTQYAVLINLIAQVTGLKPGLFTHVMNNAHIYENQFDGMNEQIRRFELMEKIEFTNNDELLLDHLKNSKVAPIDEIEDTLKVLKSNPKLKINSDIKDFYDFTIDDISLEDYESLKVIKMPVSV